MAASGSPAPASRCEGLRDHPGSAAAVALSPAAAPTPEARAPRDLSREHAPVSDFIALSGDEWPISAAMWEKHKLSEAQLEAYEADG